MIAAAPIAPTEPDAWDERCTTACKRDLRAPRPIALRSKNKLMLDSRVPGGVAALLRGETTRVTSTAVFVSRSALKRRRAMQMMSAKAAPSEAPRNAPCAHEAAVHGTGSAIGKGKRPKSLLPTPLRIFVGYGRFTLPPR